MRPIIPALAVRPLHAPRIPLSALLAERARPQTGPDADTDLEIVTFDAVEVAHLTAALQARLRADLSMGSTPDERTAGVSIALTPPVARPDDGPSAPSAPGAAWPETLNERPAARTDEDVELPLPRDDGRRSDRVEPTEPTSRAERDVNAIPDEPASESVFTLPPHDPDFAVPRILRRVEANAAPAAIASKGRCEPHQNAATGVPSPADEVPCENDRGAPATRRTRSGLRHRALSVVRAPSPLITRQDRNPRAISWTEYVSTLPVAVAGSAIAACVAVAFIAMAINGTPLSTMAALSQALLSRASAVIPDAGAARASGEGSRDSRIELVRAMPTPTLPGTVLVGPVAPGSRSAGLLEQAERQIQYGDLDAARATLSQAVVDGDALATFALAETYDPNMLAARGAGARGTPADASMAQALYGRALAAGMERARVRLEALN